MEKVGLINTTKQKVTPDEILNFIGYGPFQLAALLLAGSTYFAYGCDVSILIFAGTSLEKEWNLTVTEYAILPAVTCVPNVIGAIAFSLASDQFGRLWPYAVCITWLATFSMASAFANHFYLLVALRCMASFAIGGVPGFIVPTIVEFLPVKNRGKVIVLNGLIGTVGLCASCGLAWWLIPTYPSGGWRYYIMASTVPAFLVAIFRIVFHFESPRFLIAKGKDFRAREIFARISKINGKNLDDYLNGVKCEIVLSEPEVTDKVQEKSLLQQFLMIFHPRSLRITLSLSVIMITEALGFICSQIFLPNFLVEVGTSLYFTMMVTLLSQILGNALLSIIVEWPGVGRLNSFRFFSSLSMIFFILLTFIQNVVSIPVLLIFIYFATAPILSLLYSYISEYYPTRIRSVATAYFYILQALSNIVGSLAISKAVNISQHWLFPAVFAACYLVQLAAGLLLNYEPRGKGLKDKS